MKSPQKNFLFFILSKGKLLETGLVIFIYKVGRWWKENVPFIRGGKTGQLGLFDPYTV
jgi:hypothetical protein